MWGGTHCFCVYKRVNHVFNWGAGWINPPFYHKFVVVVARPFFLHFFLVVVSYESWCAKLERYTLDKQKKVAFPVQNRWWRRRWEVREREKERRKRHLMHFFVTLLLRFLSFSPWRTLSKSFSILFSQDAKTGLKILGPLRPKNETDEAKKVKGHFLPTCNIFNEAKRERPSTTFLYPSKQA